VFSKLPPWLFYSYSPSPLHTKNKTNKKSVQTLRWWGCLLFDFLHLRQMLNIWGHPLGFFFSFSATVWSCCNFGLLFCPFSWMFIFLWFSFFTSKLFCGKQNAWVRQGTFFSQLSWCKHVFPWCFFLQTTELLFVHTSYPIIEREDIQSMKIDLF